MKEWRKKKVGESFNNYSKKKKKNILEQITSIQLYNYTIICK